jgi:hypothetical protein
MGSAHFMRLSFKKGAYADLSKAAYRKFGASRSFFREMWDTTNLKIGNIRPKRFSGVIARIRCRAK